MGEISRHHTHRSETHFDRKCARTLLRNLRSVVQMLAARVLLIRSSR